MIPATSKLRVCVLYGGRSSEHDVSLMSATNVVAALDPARYEIVPVYVARDGRWLAGGVDADGRLATPANGTELALVPGGHGRLIALAAGEAPQELPAIDVLLPVLHGLFGEDGSVQGLAEVARVAYVGCGIAGSANALDKALAKRLLEAAGIPCARARMIRSDAVPAFDELSRELGLPIFVKPARQGSSVGVAKVTSPEAYGRAVEDGFRHDGTLLAEEFVAGREIECAVLEDAAGALFVSRPGEIAPADSHGFYTYDAKYVDAGGAAITVPADLPADVEAAVRELAERAFRAVGCDGMARVDVFVTAEGRILVNELNTIPGFTDISMYPKAMAVSGVAYPELLDRLIDHALARHRRAS